MVITQLTRSPLLVPFTLAGLIQLGCGDPATKDPDTDVCAEVPGEVCDETADGETADGETDNEPTELGPHECRHNYKPTDPIVGIQYQCEGLLHSSLSFNVVGDACTDVLDPGWCQQEDIFGVNFQPYAAAEVIACCGEYDAQYVDTYREFCTYDMYQQLCGTLAKRLEAAIHDGLFGAFDNQAAELQVWIAEHYKDCFISLQANNSATLAEPVTHWQLPDFGLLHDVMLHVDAGTKIDGVNLPVNEAEWLACSSANGNNDQVFEDAHTPKGPVTVAVGLATDLDAELIGPSLFGGMVTASASFDAGCEPRGCPRALFSLDGKGPQFTLEEFDVFDPDAVVITNGTFALVADRAQMRLWMQAPGHEVLDPSTGQRLGYEIPAGVAKFVISGFSTEAGSNRFMAVNSTDIWLSEAEGAWTIESFDVEFEDGNSELWTVTLDHSRWRQ